MQTFNNHVAALAIELLQNGYLCELAQAYLITLQPLVNCII